MMNKQKRNRKQKHWSSVLALIGVIGGLAFVSDDGLIPVANAQDNLVYVPLDSPCRVANTRNTGSTHLIAASSRDFFSFGSAVTIDAQGGNPAGCDHPRSSEGMQPAAIAATIAAVGKQASGNGNIVAYPAGSVAPSASTVNYTTAANIANSTIITLRTSDGSFTLRSNISDVPAVIDVVGYFYPMVGIEQQVDCSADANALLNTTIKDNTTYTLNGMCNGPIEVFRKRNVVIQGVDTNTKTDGIILPTGITVDPFAAIGVYESNIELRNLRLDASNYVSNSYPWGATNVAALNVGQQSIARVYDVDLVGGDFTLSAFRNAYVKTYSNVTVTGFNLGGISASYNSHVELNQNIQVVGAASTTAQYPEAVSASYNSSIDIKNGGTFTIPGGFPQFESYAIGAYHNASIRVRDDGTTNINGDVGAAHSSDIQIDGGAVVVGAIDAWDSGVIRFRDSSQSGSYVSALRLGLVRIYGSSSINTASSGFGAGQGSSIGIRNTSTVTSNSPIFINTNSTLYIRDTVDLGNAGITCQSQVNQVTISVDATNIGSLAGCP